MNLPNTILNKLKAFIDEQVDEGIKDYPIYIKVDGKLIDYDSITYSGGQIDIEISSPIFFPDTDDLASVELLPKEKEIKDIDKEFIQNNPELYNDEKHGYLFTEEEKINLSQSLRG